MAFQLKTLTANRAVIEETETGYVIQLRRPDIQAVVPLGEEYKFHTREGEHIFFPLDIGQQIVRRWDLDPSG